MFSRTTLLFVDSTGFVSFTTTLRRRSIEFVLPRSNRKGKTAQTTFRLSSYLHPFSTSILSKMAVSEKQEAVSSTGGDDPVKIEEEEEDTTVYPKGIQFVMLMASFYLGVFMVSLVRRIHSKAAVEMLSEKKPHSNLLTGQTHRQHRHPSNHERLQIARRHWMVRHSLPAHQRRVPAAFRKAVQVRTDQSYLLGVYPGVRGWLDCLRCGSELDCVHYRKSDCWCGSWRSSFRRGEFGARL
jgi:hypothetical protein